MIYSLITLKDIIIVPLLLLIAYFISTNIKNRHIQKESFYKYYRIGLFAKLWAGLAFAAVYLFYYGGGDTTTYFFGTESIIKMAGKDFPTFIKILIGNNTNEVFSMFDYTTGYPEYWRDVNSFAVCRFNVPLYLLGGGSYLGNTVVFNLFLYTGVWRFYKMMMELFAQSEKTAALALLFIPSVLFWGSGILKDGWCLTSTFFIFISLYHIFIKKTKILLNLISLILWGYVSISIRPYTFYTAMGAGLVWVGFYYIMQVKGRFLRTVVFPVVVVIVWLTGAAIFTNLSMFAGNRYNSMDAMIETAWVIQDDLKKDYYGGNSFDIGTFEPTLGGIIMKAPKAITAGIFRPFIWEVKTVFMALSGLETLFLLLFFIYLLVKIGILTFFRSLFSNPFLIACFAFFVTYAFFVGLTTANFGALVRYRMPVFVFFAIILIVLYRNHVKKEAT
ncbi:MAG: hypothetical protein WCX31_04900 [Salinivirgaceae bacterium]